MWAWAGKHDATDLGPRHPPCVAVVVVTEWLRASEAATQCVSAACACMWVGRACYLARAMAMWVVVGIFAPSPLVVVIVGSLHAGAIG